ncbi:MAG: hypothetical protein HKO07_05105, partial [Pseudomonadales bacterium]|nr:hypothetical protein [Pseudomonadales bacterium]
MRQLASHVQRLATVFSALAVLFGTHAYAANPDDIYLIEMVAFVDDRATGRDAASGAPGSERWRKPEELAYPGNLGFLSGGAQRVALAAQNAAGAGDMPLMQLLRVNDSAIDEIANKLRTRSPYRVIFEGSWLQ